VDAAGIGAAKGVIVAMERFSTAASFFLAER
jgi:hypothetical protein